jgi:hypothetical protein
LFGGLSEFFWEGYRVLFVIMFLLWSMTDNRFLIMTGLLNSFLLCTLILNQLEMKTTFIILELHIVS